MKDWVVLTYDKRQITVNISEVKTSKPHNKGFEKYSDQVHSDVKTSKPHNKNILLGINRFEEHPDQVHHDNFKKEMCVFLNLKGEMKGEGVSVNVSKIPFDHAMEELYETMFLDDSNRVGYLLPILGLTGKDRYVWRALIGRGL